jgi:flagellum-specific ATP synthase
MQMPLMIQHHDRKLERLKNFSPVTHTGKLVRIMPTWIEADGPNVPVGTLCTIGDIATLKPVCAEVIRIDSNGIALVPFSDMRELSVGSRVAATAAMAKLPVGYEFLGRAVDGLGQPIDDGGEIVASAYQPLDPDPPLPLERMTSDEILQTGIRTIDGLLPVGRGQRIGIFAASGVGKTSLISQLLRQVKADICICCLVGERGREVEAIWANELSGPARKRSILVAATSDQAAAVRVRAVRQANALARFFRDAGLDVFLVVDSITRFAMALRELGLAAGEPPTVRAYTPSVFSVIPRLVEQAGALKSGGSISAAVTILSENDDVDDPLSEMMKSLLDGHLILSRQMAERGMFPAINPLKSVSRNAHKLMTASHRASADKGHVMLSTFEQSRTLIDAGLYVAGSNATIDAAISAQQGLDDFMRQPMDQHCTLEQTIDKLAVAVGGSDV